MIHDVLVWIQELGPWGIFSFLVLCSFGLPIAKSLLLILAGMLAHQNPEQLALFFAAAVLGLHCGDFALFLLGRILDDKLFSLPLIHRLIPTTTVEKARAIIEKHGAYSLVIARLTPYVRGACYLMLGSLRMNPLKFNVLNIAICLVYSMFFFVPGYLLVTQLENLKRISRYGNIVLFSIFIILLVGFILRLRIKKRKSQSKVEL